MLPKSILVSACSFVVGAVVGLTVCSASVCSASGSAVAPNRPDDGPGCSLDAPSLATAATEAAAFNRRYLTSVQTSITAVYDGDKATLNDALDAIIAREASCCSHLTITKQETARGYEVTIKGARDAVDELQMILASTK